jgi:signal peptidase
MDYLKDQLLEQLREQRTAIKGLLRNKRLALFSLANLAMIVFSALMLWKGLIAVTGSDSPVVVVLSGSMEPAFQRGDVLLLDNNRADIAVGDIVVFKIAGRDIPIVHRVLRAHVRVANASSAADEAADYLTKGDNNAVDDRNLYAPGQLWLKRSEIIGRAVASVPFVGMMTILLNDYPVLKWVLVGLMGFFVLLGKD